MQQPKFLEIEPSKLAPNPWNSNIVAPANEAKLEESVRRNGLFKPIIVREIDAHGKTELQIIGGEHRWHVATKLGLATVPIVNLGPIDDVRAKEIGVLDNARYGADDALSLAEVLKDIAGIEELQSFLPYADADLTQIFSASDIALDELELSLDDENTSQEQAPEPPAAREPKTHTIMRFKVPLRDGEKLSALIGRTQKQHNFTGSDELTNAGDALVHLLMNQFAAAEQSLDKDLELEALLQDAISEETPDE